MSNDDRFNANLAFMKKHGKTDVQLMVQPEPPTLEEVNAWAKPKNLGSFKASVRDDGRIEQITWDRSVDQDLFLRWMKKRGQR